MRLVQKGWINAEWGTSENNRKAKFYSISKTGRRQLVTETQNWERVAGIIGNCSSSARGGDQMLDALRERCARIRAFFRASDLDRDFEEELQSHIAMLSEDNVRRARVLDRHLLATEAVIRNARALNPAIHVIVRVRATATSAGSLRGELTKWSSQSSRRVLSLCARYWAGRESIRCRPTIW